MRALLDTEKNCLVWIRQDFRLYDNPVLVAAMATGKPVIMLFILEEYQDNPWPLGAASKWWLAQSLMSLQRDLTKEYGLKIILRRGQAWPIIKDICLRHNVRHVYWGRRYEPFLMKQDQNIKKYLKEMDVDVQSYNTALLHEPWEIQNNQGQYFKIFTPYWKKIAAYPVGKILQKPPSLKIFDGHIESDEVKSFGLQPRWSDILNDHWTFGEQMVQDLLLNFYQTFLQDYENARNFPDVAGTSRLSPYLHWGQISVRQLWHDLEGIMMDQPELSSSANSFRRELAWREFNHHLLYHFPDLPEQPWRSEFANISWSSDINLLQRWQKGRTGYPIIDAGLRELWHTGWMHNRVRMIVASFLVKNLRLSWIEGQRWFWDTLVDADLAQNAGNWQWVAGCGADAAPYFRIFNPTIQAKKFDPYGNYIRRWLPELAGLPTPYIFEPHLAKSLDLESAGVVLGQNYPYPVVDWIDSRQAALQAYKSIKN